MNQQAIDERHMQRALELAKRGEGRVEPNPMVGCVLALGERVIGEGWHERFGDGHAEVSALRAASTPAAGATAYVTLEPCCHTGKTPPCSKALIDAGVARVVVAKRDPFPKVDGGGIAELRAAGVSVDLGVGAEAATNLMAPYLKLTTAGRPWVIAKWAMTLDGKIATRTGSSQWISNEASRRIVHGLRGRVDAVLAGRRTVIVDDPLLTARPAGARLATRVVLGTPPRDCRLLKTIEQAPVLIIAGEPSEAASLAWAEEAGAEVATVQAEGNPDRFAAVMDELGRRRMTNVLVEGGAGVLGAALDAGQVDEVHVFVGPKLVGGQPSPSPIAGAGVEAMAGAIAVSGLAVESVEGDAYLHGRVSRGVPHHTQDKVV